MFWKDTVALTAESVGRPPEQEWLVLEEQPLVGANASIPGGGLAGVFFDEVRGQVWTRAYDSRGEVRFDGVARTLAPPHAGLVAVNRSGMMFSVYQGKLREDSSNLVSAWETLSSTGGLVRSSPATMWYPWTHARAMFDDDVLLVAAGDGAAAVRMCRVGMADHAERWCDEFYLNDYAPEEDNEFTFNHAYTPAIEFVEPAVDGGFYLGGTLRGTRDVVCAEGLGVCPETTVESWAARYSEFGEQLWYTRFASFPWVLDEQPTGIAVTEDGGLLIGGWWSPRLDDGTFAQRGFVARLDADGVVKFARSYEGELVDAFVNFSSDARGGGIATVLSASLETILLLDVDDDANVRWSRKFEELPLAWSFDEESHQLALAPHSLDVRADLNGDLILVCEPGEQPELGPLPTTLLMKLR